MPEIRKLVNEFDCSYDALQKAIKGNDFHEIIDILGYLYGLTKAMTIILDCNTNTCAKEDRTMVNSRISSLSCFVR